MSKDTDKSLFIVSSMPRLYQHLLSGVVGFEALGNRILSQIKTAHAFRQVEQVKELARVLINIPIREYQLIAQYYLVWCKCREYEYPAETLERIIEQTQTYKSQALSSRAAFEGFRGQLESAMCFYIEALKAARTVSEHIAATLGAAMIKGIEGFHQSALNDIERIFPLIGYSESGLFFNFHNSYATELVTVGRLSEARNISKIVMASPFAPFYPEWQETANDLKLASRSFVVINPSPYISRKVLPKLEREQGADPKPENELQTASIVSFPPLKEAPPPQKPERLSPQEINELTASEKGELILTAIKSGTLRESDYDKMMILAGLLKSGPADKILDLEDEALLDDIIAVWANQIEPEELAAVLSALRDCADDLRRNDIIDSMIRIAFEQTQLCGLTEEQWRLRVERRLPKR